MKTDWKYEYGGVQPRTILSKIKLVLNAVWFIPYLCFYLAWHFIKGDL